MRYIYRDHVISEDHMPGAVVVLEDGDPLERVLAVVSVASEAESLIDEVLADLGASVELVEDDDLVIL